MKDDPQSARARFAWVIVDSMTSLWAGLLAPDGTILFRPRVAAQATGLPNPDAVGRPFWEIESWAPASAARARAAVAEAAAGGEARFEAEIRARHPEPRALIVDVTIRPLRDESGRIAYLLVEGDDITERRRAETELARKNEELRGLYERLKELDRLKTRFFANVSHELRTPLALILGVVDRLERAALLGGGGGGGVRRPDLEVARRNARILLGHVNDLLDVSKLDAGKLEPRRADVDVARLVRLVASNFESLAHERRIEQVVRAEGSLRAEVDPEKVQRILANLISNAHKFTPAGGRVRVSLRAGPAEAPVEAVLEVADSGPGIAEALRERVFERFFQAGGEAAPGFGGTGLGLAIAKELALLHGGRIVAGEAPEGGALFTVTLPLRAPPGAAVGPAAPAPPLREAVPAVAGAAVAEAGASSGEGDGAGLGPPDRPLVLVVEDNLEMRRLLVDTLGPGYRVACAGDGAAGLAQALALRPDLVLTDVMMPELGGRELLRALRARRELDAVPVVVLTARADDDLRVGCLREGAQDYVLKPFSADELRARVDNLIALKRTHELRRLSEVATKGQEDERRRLALALHDGAGQVLAAVANHLDDATARAPEPLARRLGEIRSLVGRLHDDLRRLSHDLRPLALDDLGLVEALRDLAGGVATDALAVEVAVDPPDLAPPPDVAIAIFRIVQAALANVQRHARARRAWIRLAADPDAGRLALEVEDDGAGFDRRQVGPDAGVGLVGMRERAAWLGGTLEVDSAPGRGTRIRVAVPVAFPAREPAPVPAPVQGGER